jgi:hypothetical protein
MDELLTMTAGWHGTTLQTETKLHSTSSASEGQARRRIPRRHWKYFAHGADAVIENPDFKSPTTDNGNGVGGTLMAYTNVDTLWVAL